MMLESGNDAAQAVAENIGKLWEDIKEQEDRGIYIRPRNIVVILSGKGDSKNGEQTFIKHMNKYGYEMELKNTTF